MFTNLDWHLAEIRAVDLCIANNIVRGPFHAVTIKYKFIDYARKEFFKFKVRILRFT